MNFQIFSLLPIVTVATLISLQGYAFWVLSSENSYIISSFDQNS